MNAEGRTAGPLIQRSSFLVRRLALASTAAQAAARAEEAFVVAHDELRLDLRDGVHGDADQNQERRAAEVELVAHAVRNPAQTGRARHELLDAAPEERQTPDVEA